MEKGSIEIEKEKGAAVTIDDLKDHLFDVYNKVMVEGKMDAGAWSCGMVVGLIRDIPSVGELVDRVMAETVEIIKVRLGSPF